MGVSWELPRAFSEMCSKCAEYDLFPDELRFFKPSDCFDIEALAFMMDFNSGIQSAVKMYFTRKKN